MKDSHRGQTRRRRRRGLAVAGLCWLATGCGTDPAVTTIQSPPPIPQPTVNLDQRSYVLAPGQSMTARAQVTGGANLALQWALNCETGGVTLSSSGNSAVLTASSSGSCFLWAIRADASGGGDQGSPLAARRWLRDGSGMLTGRTAVPAEPPILCPDLHPSVHDRLGLRRQALQRKGLVPGGHRPACVVPLSP